MSDGIFAGLKVRAWPIQEMTLAAFFGKRLVFESDGWRLIAHRWRGDIYIKTIERVGHAHEKGHSMRVDMKLGIGTEP